MSNMRYLVAAIKWFRKSLYVVSKVRLAVAYVVCLGDYGQLFWS
jgi:hypothetical protein